MGVLGFFREISSLFQTVFLSFWAAFLLPAGMMIAIVYGGWLYFGPFLAANILLSIKFNKARKTGRIENYDDKAFTKYSKSIDEYVQMIDKRKEKRPGP